MIRQFWTEAEVAILRDLYPTTRARHILEFLPARTERQVLEKAWRLGLKKPVDTIRQHARESMQDINHRGRAHQFKVGQRTWNTGLKGWEAGGRSAETRFKKGRPAHEASNYLPIGSVRINHDGYVERKITDDPALYPARRWVPVHRLVWIDANGPVPAGHIVVFRPGMKTVDIEAITVDKVECISMAENMRRNTVHNLPKPVAQLVQLRGALARKINRLSRQDHDHQRPE
jgi:hypothetical protein